MAEKRRTKKQKIRAAKEAVNSQFNFSFQAGTIPIKKTKKIERSVESADIGSIKKDIIKSLIIASLIIASIVVLYCVS